MKIVKVIIVDDENNEQELTVQDGSALLVCDENKILTQVTKNAAINLELIKKVLGDN